MFPRSSKKPKALHGESVGIGGAFAGRVVTADGLRYSRRVAAAGGDVAGAAWMMGAPPPARRDSAVPLRCRVLARVLLGLTRMADALTGSVCVVQRTDGAFRLRPPSTSCAFPLTPRPTPTPAFERVGGRIAIRSANS